MKPILFNTEMVRAILEGRKTVTRRAVKPKLPESVKEFYPEVRAAGIVWRSPGHDLWAEVTPIYHPGDILYVRETWSPVLILPKRYIYKADADQNQGEGAGLPIRWRPSIHMPKEAARLFLRVTGVRVEQLQDITEEQIDKEGVQAWSKDGMLYKYAPADCEGDGPNCEWSECPRTPKDGMKRIWNSTIKPADLDCYGWDANPWVWVIEFERISKEAAVGGGGGGV